MRLCRKQAVFALAWFRDRPDIPRLGKGFGISQATAYRYLAGAGCERDDGGADAVGCLGQENGAVAGVLADGVAERGDSALGGLEGGGG